MATTNTRDRLAEARARAHYTTGLLWHLGAFAIVNGFFWLLDGAVGEPGIQWAYWITGVWAFGLAFHVLAWFIDGRAVEDRKTRQYLDQP